jgi:hypothetical protein
VLRLQHTVIPDRAPREAIRNHFPLFNIETGSGLRQNHVRNRARGNSTIGAMSHLSSESKIPQ